MLKIKAGVSILGLKPEAVVGLNIASEVFSSFGADCWVTSGTDGKHGPHSHHKKGLAFDLRRRHVPELINSIVEELQECLGKEFQVILETSHIHVEYDPI